jgi:hypothetical protein
VSGLLKREAEAEGAMLQEFGADPNVPLAIENAVYKVAGLQYFSLKSILEAKPGRTQRFIGSDLRDDKDEVRRKPIDEIPPISVELMPHRIDEAIRPVQVDRLLSSNQNSQQMVEPDEVIDMNMRDEYALNPLNAARRQF